MSGDETPLAPEAEDAALAAEYVLRLLGPEEAAACAAREARDPAFAARVAEWRAAFEGLDGAFVPVPPPAALGERIEARLFGAPPSRLAALWRSVGLWRALAAAAAVAALYLGTLGREPLAPPGEAPARLVSAVAAVDSDVELLAFFEPEAAVLNINRTGGAPAPGRALELWMIEGTSAPVSLGVLPDTPRARLPLSRDVAARLAPGVVLAVSDEPEGGSPTGQPTGAVLAAGPISEL